jgi:hypothetical protein
MKRRAFSSSFRPRYRNLKTDEECALENHYSGALRELVGRLNHLAGLDTTGERFVFSGVDNMVEKCHRYQQPENRFSKSMIEKVLKELRSRYIISKRLVRVRDGKEYVGFIVAPHDYLAVRDKPTECVLRGQLKAPGRWRRDPILDEKGEWTGKFGPVYAYCAAPVTDAITDAVTVPITDATSVQPTAAAAVTYEKRPLTVRAVGAVKSVEPSKPKNPVTESGQGKTEKGNGNPNSKSDDELGKEIVCDTTDQKQIETIADRFADLPDDYRDAIIAVSTGLISDSDISAIANGQHFYSWPDLVACCRDVVRQRAGMPYLGRKTHGDLMAGAMALFTERHKIKAPKNWYAVAKTLRESAPEKSYREDYSEHNAEMDRLVAEMAAEAAAAKKT